MKKLLAFLAACATMTCMFASCGDKEEESTVSSESSVSAESSEETAEETTEEVAEEETTEVSEEETEETEEETPAEESQEETESETHEYIEDADTTAFIGKWECEKISTDGEEVDELMGIPVYALYQYDIMEDGTAGISESLMEVATEEDKLEYTWGLISENEIEIVSSDGDTIQFTLDGDYLVSIDEATKTEIYLKKVDEFQYFDFQAFIDNYQQEQNGMVLTPVETDADGNIIESSETTTAE